MPGSSTLHVPQRFAPYLAGTERVLGIVQATRDLDKLTGVATHSGTLILTDRRLIFVAAVPDEGVVGYYPLPAIERLDGTRSLLGWQISFEHARDVLHFKWITAPNARAFYRAIRAQQKVARREAKKVQTRVSKPVPPSRRRAA